MEPLEALARTKLSNKRVIAVMSAKGGVGKSIISALLSLSFSSSRQTTLIDLDIHTMASTKLFGLEGKVHEVNKKGIVPFSFGKLGVISLGGIVKDRYVVLPGSNTRDVMQSLIAYSDVGEIIVFDLPPGLGDEVLLLEHLTDFTPIVVTIPSKVSVKVVEYLLRYLKERGKRPVLVVNMAYFDCNGKKARPFGGMDYVKNVSEKYGLSLVEAPIDPEIEDYIGRIHEYNGVVRSKIKEVENLVGFPPYSSS
ncbi:P-loop NTPase [Stygiolobus caldivivus]|uniref:ATP-binding protein n=1 Tax=Stygiolobus caldivivus TaxID=2824673 RepID=A0A8D5U5M3_9CREN|nr:P-loop NTPase [Stygiolobus caldivivus]BCU69702.1 ATP-binding protein [Stygiolobus caldivivus]